MAQRSCCEAKTRHLLYDVDVGVKLASTAPCAEWRAPAGVPEGQCARKGMRCSSTGTQARQRKDAHMAGLLCLLPCCAGVVA